jgi:hypothetical protein
MIPILENITKKIWSQKTLTEMAVDALVLTDSSGDVLDLANTNGKNKGLYKIAAAGAGTEYFYHDFVPGGKTSFKLTGFKVSVDAAVTLSGTLQFYRDGDWVDNPAYDFAFDSATAQKMNGVYPLEEGIYGTPVRIKCVVGGACNVFCQAVIG